ncbi:phage tail tape measure protein [Allosphingosinicella flava]|uniref:Phage tail tape measure protein n=1 Tax=Allosphingosinicella flava TaxID=2771430 RepID=A0A7T2GLI4_9SPHN|nr:phage tail tape measure protein [Sphingosinicella flava]QPQ56075.1 phage tail tape measure protein [Sphingosinicella flava]
MDEEIESLLVSVRADTAAFARDVAAMRGELDGPLAAGADRAGRALENALLRAVRTGKIGFDDLKRVALSAMAEIAGNAVRGGVGAMAGNGGQGLVSLAGQLLAGALGLPGRATGGPVAPGRAYLVGERGPEVFVPTSSGRVETGIAPGGRDVRLSITINAGSGDGPQALAQSSRQVARAVKRALMQVGD